MQIRLAVSQDMKTVHKNLSFCAPSESILYMARKYLQYLVSVECSLRKKEWWLIHYLHFVFLLSETESLRL